MASGTTGVTGSANAGVPGSGGGITGDRNPPGPNPPPQPKPPPGGFGSTAIGVGPASVGPGQGAGTTGVTGSGTVGSALPPGGIQGSFDDTAAGAGLQSGWTAFRHAFVVQMPHIGKQMDILAHRGIGG